MNRLVQRNWRSGWSAGRWTVIVVFAGACLAWAEVKTVPAPSAGSISPPPAAQTAANASATTAKFSPGVQEVLRLVEAKAAPEVIKAYVQESPAAYPLSASEIVALKDLGVSSDVLVAMLRHGRDLSAQNPPAPATPPPYVAGLEAPPAAPGYAAAPQQPAYPSDYAAADYSYPYAYSGGYPYWWWNSYSYPLVGAYWVYGHRYCRYPVGYYHNYGYPGYHTHISGVYRRTGGAPYSPAFGGRGGHPSFSGGGGRSFSGAHPGGGAGGRAAGGGAHR